MLTTEFLKDVTPAKLAKLQPSGETDSNTLASSSTARHGPTPR
ncbi:MAG: hypothetical protein ACLU38_15855 [Dysosmobacter sp.]